MPENDAASLDRPVPAANQSLFGGSAAALAKAPFEVVFAGDYSDPAAQSPIRHAAARASRFLAHRVRTRSLPMRNAGPLVTFTFDDVTASGCREGAAILEGHGAHGTYYVAGAGCGRMSLSGALASIDQIKALAAKGHEIGCHTYTHPAVTTIDLRDLERELRQNREFLSECIGVVPHNFAFPYGDLSLRSKWFLEQRFDSCRSIHPSMNTLTLDLGGLRAFPLENASTDQAKVAVAVADAVRSNGWLIFYSHDVERSPSRFGVTPDLLSFTVAAAKSAGCRIVTIAAGLECVKGGDDLA
jgi:peptidoglycan/xylan/chitin deacetylase (PgdA/CDA1 family)